MNEVMHISGVSVGYKKPLLEGLDLSLEKGQLVALTGRNGTGKTTLLKTIAGILQPLKGIVAVGGRDLSKETASSRAGLVSIVLTQRIFLAGIDIKTLVMMGRYPSQGRFTFSNEKDELLVKECMQKMNIDHLADKPLSELSDGEMQKAMIARVLAQQTPLLIMDEPTAFLDYVAKEELFVLLRRLCKEEGMTIIFSSHDLELVKKYADKTLLIEKGLLIS